MLLLVKTEVTKNSNDTDSKTENVNTSLNITLKNMYK